MKEPKVTTEGTSNFTLERRECIADFNISQGSSWGRTLNNGVTLIR